MFGSNQQVQAIIKEAQEAQAAGNYEEAQAKLNTLKKLPEQLQGSTDEKRKILNDIIKIYGALARNYQESKDFVMAKKLLHRAVEIECLDEEWLHEGGLATESYMQLMKVHATDKELNVEKRLDDLEKTSDSVVQLIEDGHKLESKRQFEDALEVFKEAEKLCAPGSTDKAAVSAAMVDTLIALGKRKEAIFAAKEALQIYKDRPPKFPNQTAVPSLQLAQALEAEGRREEASEAYARALEIVDRHPHEVIDEVFYVVAGVQNLISLKRYSEAEQLEARFVKEAVASRKSIDSFKVLNHYVDVGNVYFDQRLLQKAKASYIRAITWAGESYPDQMKGSVGFAYMKLADCEVQLGDLEESAEHAIIAVDLVEVHLRVGCAGVFNNLAGHYAGKGQPQKARLLHERSLKACESSVGRNSLPTISTLIQYSDSAMECKDPAKSRWCLKEALSRANQIPDSKEKSDYVDSLKRRWRDRKFQ